MSRSVEWSWEALMDCAAHCRTWREFCIRFPLAYASAHKRNLTDALKRHCGYASDGIRTFDAPPLTEALDGLLRDHGMEMPDALYDPFWPMALEDKPLREEID